MPPAPRPVLRRVFRTALFLSALSSAAAESIRPTYEIEVLEPRQAIKDWGLAFSPNDWDGRPQLPSGESIRQQLAASGVTIGRVTVGPTMRFNLKAHRLDANQANLVLSAQIDALRAIGIDRYVLVITSPPKALKHYYSDDGSVQFDPNYLRPSAEGDFCQYVTSLIAQIKTSGQTEPSALCFASEPDRGFLCHYPAGQWRRVALLLRKRLDAAGFASVGIIGPDTFAPAAIAEYLTPETEEGRKTADALAGISFSLGPASRWTHDDFAGMHTLLENYAPSRRGLWALNLHLEESSYSKWILRETFQRLARDLAILGADHWFWDYGYTPASASNSLLSGTAGTPAAVFPALSLLWTSAPPGAQVRPMATNDPLLHAASPTQVGAVGFSYRGITTIIIINPAAESRTYRLKGILKIDQKSALFLPSRQPLVTHPADQASVVVELPAEAVALIVSLPP
jgi:hypothetical protein